MSHSNESDVKPPATTPAEAFPVAPQPPVASSLVGQSVASSPAAQEATGCSASSDFGNDAASIQSVLIAVACVGAAATGGAWFLRGPWLAVSVGYGALLGFGNLLLLGRMVRAFLAKEGVSSPWLIAALVKLVVLCLALYLPVRARYVELLPFVFGFGALPVGIVLGQFLFLPQRSKAS